MILATGITAVLLVAVYQAIALHYVQMDAGREVAEQAQLLRGISQRLRHDLRATYSEWEPTEPADTSASSDSSAGSSTSQQSSSTSSESSTSTSTTATDGSATVSQIDPPLGLFGDHVSMTLVTRVVPADLDFALVAGGTSAGPPVSDIRTVWYGTEETTNDAGEPILALVRVENAWLPDSDAAADPTLYARTEVIAEGVQSFAIRYYNGTDWLQQWTSDKTSVPSAVEVTINVILPQLGRRAATKGAVQTAGYRMVFAPLRADGAASATEDQ